jgi:hypothetical protein
LKISETIASIRIALYSSVCEVLYKVNHFARLDMAPNLTAMNNSFF